MKETFVLEDLLNMMIELETFGNENYQRLALNTTNSSLKEYFTTLAEMELKHKHIFEGFKEEAVTYPGSELDEDYTDYLKSILKNAVRFMKINRNSEHMDDFEAAFDLAVTLEKDAILFLIEIRTLIPSDHHHIIDRLIAEERSHLKYLYNYIEGA
ncbi:MULTISPECIES: ferritin family protein [unclassified Fusibacter]|uniref:ferritin family protein n=1 Tax=unclassified Fusibacter TaxID=2624464 RepID=UPI001010B05C|nr:MULTISPECIES: ferritin family protein [unclassified Fusibacter]MCK8060501.1 hypothetical protein [Fusibacter sp. A2]NPE20210.1 hypothetical protein [Fusibacter sp. A1]RXV63419.1 hypothetical protein DWB64_00160 [Fusibacter sp. A1]